MQVYNILPQNTLSSLCATDIQVLDLIGSMCKAQGKKGASGAWYCFPSETWLAGKVGRSREWISHSVNRLQKLGLVNITRRRKVRGHWQTNLYRLSLYLLGLLKNTKAWFQTFLHHVKSTSHIVKEPYIIKDQTAKKSDFSHKFKAPPLENIISRMEKAHPELT